MLDKVIGHWLVVSGHWLVVGGWWLVVGGLSVAALLVCLPPCFLFPVVHSLSELCHAYGNSSAAVGW